MAELNLDRITALSKEPPHALSPNAQRADALTAAGAAVRLLAVFPDPTGKRPRTPPRTTSR